MDFRVSDEQQIAVDSIRRFLDEVVRPVMAEFDDTFIPKERMQALLKQLHDFGLGNGLTAEEDGGMGLDPVTFGLLFEELARVSPDVAIVVLIQEESRPVTGGRVRRTQAGVPGPAARG